MSSWANRNVVRRRNLSQIPAEARPTPIGRAEQPLVVQSEAYQARSEMTSTPLSTPILRDFSSLYKANKKENEVVYPVESTGSVQKAPSAASPNPLSFLSLSSSLLIPAIQPQSPHAVLLTDEDATFVFVILRTLRTMKDNQLWITCYNSIRQFYTNQIVIIDDNSTINTVNGRLTHTEVIKSDFNGAGELLPYYYFLQHKWADRMIFLHDSMFLVRPFTREEIRTTCQFHWYFSDTMEETTMSRLLSYVSLLQQNKEFTTYLQMGPVWKGCFGCATLIDYSVVSLLEEKYKLFSSMIMMVRTRADREIMERLLGQLLFFEGKVEEESCSHGGDILRYPQAFELPFTTYETIKHLLQQRSYSGAIAKVWRGR